MASTSPLSSGRRISISVASACAAGLRSGAGRSSAVPTRLECKRSRAGCDPGAAPRGTASSVIQLELPRTCGFSQSRLPAFASSASISDAACSVASNACAGSRTCGPARSDSSPGAPSWRTCRSLASKPPLSKRACPRTCSNASFQRCSARRTPPSATVPSIRAGIGRSWCSGSSMRKRACAGPDARRLSRTSRCSLCSGLPRNRVRKLPASPAAAASTCSSALPKRAIPALSALTGTPARLALPLTVNPSATKLRSASMRCAAGQSGWNFTVPSAICASARNTPAPARPGSLRNGQSSRSPATTAWTLRRVPPCSAASSHCTVAFGIRWWIQKPCAADTGTSPMSTARSRCGRLPSPSKPMPPRACNRRGSPSMASPGVRTVQPLPSRHSTASPSSVNACTTPNPAGQSNATCASRSKRSRSPSWSACSQPLTPRMPGACPTGSKRKPSRRALARSRPPRSPASTRSCTSAPGAVLRSQ